MQHGRLSKGRLGSRTTHVHPRKKHVRGTSSLLLHWSTTTVERYCLNIYFKMALPNLFSMPSNCKSFKLDKSNAVSLGTTAILSTCQVGLVWFARYCGKTFCRYLFSYGELELHFHLADIPSNSSLFKDVLTIKEFLYCIGNVHTENISNLTSM